MNGFVILLISIAVVSPLVSSGILGPVKAATAATSTNTKTPIKHLVILFQENVSFDHYFGTYPNATNPPGEPKFIANPQTPSGNGLKRSLLHNNTNAANPFRLDRKEAVTCDMKHDYTDEQKAYNGGARRQVCRIYRFDLSRM